MTEKLYELTAELRFLMDTAVDGELTPEVLERFQQIEVKLDDKINSMLKVMATMQRNSESCKAEIDRLAGHIERNDRNVARMKEYLLAELRRLGAKSHKTALWSVTRVTSQPKSVCTADPLELGASLVRTRHEANHSAAIAQYKRTGIAPRGFEITQGEHLLIK